MILKALIAYGIFAVVWFAGLFIYLYYKKKIAPLVLKISHAPVQVKQEITRNFGYGFIFSGGMSFIISAILGIVNGVNLIQNHFC